MPITTKNKDMNFYIRFTDNINRDIRNGSSKDFKSGDDLSGLCAWPMRFSGDIYDDEAIIKEGVEYAEQIARNTYGGYSDGKKYSIVEGEYVGSSNDGVCISVVRVLKTLTIED